jgi:hypothetical protein
LVLAIAGAIDKLEHKQKYVVWQHNPYHYCLEILVERFVRWLSRHGFVGDVLIECRDKYADKRLKNAYSHFYEHGNDHVTPQTAQRVLLSKELKLEPKEANIAGHQLADSLAHPVLKYLKCENLNEPIAVGFGARLVNALLVDKFARHPKTNVIKGWGHKWLPE